MAGLFFEVNDIDESALMTVAHRLRRGLYDTFFSEVNKKSQLLQVLPISGRCLGLCHI
jgi:hypothetical protein